MLFAGHMVLAYFLNQPLQKKWHITYSLPLLFCASILPDMDFIFSPIIAHHTVTHSLTFWSVICVALIIIKRLDGLPYVIAILSHFLIGDIITGNPPLFYGFSDQTFGNFSTTISSEYGKDYEMLYAAAVEVAVVGLFVIYTITKKNLPPLFSFPMKHVLVLGLVALSIFIGTLDTQIVFATTNQNEISYLAYLMILLCQIIFLAIFVKGTSRISVRQLTKPDT
jgi:hypothetical protein